MSASTVGSDRDSDLREELTWSETPSKYQPEGKDFRKLPEPIPFEDMGTTQETRDAPDPTLGRDADNEWLLRNGAG